MMGPQIVSAPIFHQRDLAKSEANGPDRGCRNLGAFYEEYLEFKELKKVDFELADEGDVGSNPMTQYVTH